MSLEKQEVADNLVPHAKTIEDYYMERTRTCVVKWSVMIEDLCDFKSIEKFNITFCSKISISNVNSSRERLKPFKNAQKRALLHHIRPSVGIFTH